MKAPYNFIPLNKEVFFPEWADNVSQEYPFENSESGSIDIEIETFSPIFIKNSKEYAQNEVMEFCHFIDENGNKKYYIPGSSLKGMIRNVLEILSFSKIDFIDDDTYAVRDLSSAQNFYMKQMNLIDKPFTRAGWLKKEGEKYIIEDCGTPGRISHQEIDKAFNIEFAKYFQSPLFDSSDNNQKTAKYKYDIIGQITPTIKVGPAYSSKTNQKYDKRQFHKYDTNGKEGILVLTGQPTPRQNSGQMGDGKGFEFVFFEKQTELEVDKKVFENFKFAYFDGKDTQPKESPDWTFWKEKLYNGEKIPVFFQKDDKGNVLHFGLSYLYKLPYEHSIKEGLYSEHLKDKLDLAQTIFGIESNEEKNKGLKGRVIFSHLEGFNCEEDGIKEEILATPRASYYPIYISQNCNNGSVENYKTYNDDEFKIAGRKRYPIRNRIFSTNPIHNQLVNTKFKPLKKGKFKGKMVYHNLKKEELGAILSAITFHLNNECYHNIGMAKPLGYGKIKIKINGIDAKEYIKEFEKVMFKFKNNWIESDELIELFTMAKEHDFNDLYMRIDPEDEFRKEKTAKHCLRKFSDIVNDRVYPQSLLTKEEKQQYLSEQAKKEAEKQQYINESIKIADIMKRIESINLKQDIKNVITQIETTFNSITIEEFKNKLLSLKDELNQKIKELEEKESFEKLYKQIDYLITNKKIEELKPYLTKELPESIKEKIHNFINSFEDKKSDFIEEIKNAGNLGRIQKLLDEKNYKLNSEEESAFFERIKNLKSKEKKQFFKKIKKIPDELAQKIQEILKGN